MARRKYKEYDLDLMGVEEKTVETSHAEVETAGPETINGIIVNTPLVNVRKKPVAGAEIVETLREGDKVTILGTEYSFYKVSTSVNKNVYIVSDFVRVLKEG